MPLAWRGVRDVVVRWRQGLGRICRQSDIIATVGIPGTVSDRRDSGRSLGYVRTARFPAGGHLAGIVRSATGPVPGPSVQPDVTGRPWRRHTVPLPIIGGSIVITGFAIIAGRAIAMPGPSLSSLMQGALRHIGFLVLSVLQGAFGVAALQLGAIAIAILVPISNIVSVIAILVLSRPAGERNMKRAILSEIARNPLLGSMLIGVAVNLLDIPVPVFLAQAAVFLGDAALPLLLMSIGASLRFAAIRSNAAPLALAVAAKIIVFPMTLVLIGVMVGLGPLALVVLAAVGAAPTASSTYTLATELGGDAQLMAEIVSLQTLASAMSLPLWIWIAGIAATA